MLDVHACGGMSEMHPGASVPLNQFPEGVQSQILTKKIDQNVFIKK